VAPRNRTDELTRETMTMNRFLRALLLLPVLASTALAQPGVSGPGGGRALESHYFSVEVGVPLNSYPADTRALIDELDAYDGVSRIPVDFSFAVLWPVIDNQTLLGPQAQVTSDHLSRGDVQVSFNVVTLGATARRYLTGTIASGLYARADVGIASAGITHRIEDAERSKSGNFGFGSALGAGFALPVSSGTSLELSATAAYRLLPGYETGSRGYEDIFEKGEYLSAIFGVAVVW
jgi:hypothetical protein